MKQRSLWEKGITWLLVVIMIATIVNPGIRNKVLASAEDTTPPVISEILYMDAEGNEELVAGADLADRPCQMQVKVFVEDESEIAKVAYLFYEDSGVFSEIPENAVQVEVQEDGGYLIPVMSNTKIHIWVVDENDNTAEEDIDTIGEYIREIEPKVLGFYTKQEPEQAGDPSVFIPYAGEDSWKNEPVTVYIDFDIVNGNEEEKEASKLYKREIAAGEVLSQEEFDTGWTQVTEREEQYFVDELDTVGANDVYYKLVSYDLYTSDMKMLTYRYDTSAPEEFEPQFYQDRDCDNLPDTEEVEGMDTPVVYETDSWVTGQVLCNMMIQDTPSGLSKLECVKDGNEEAAIEIPDSYITKNDNEWIITNYPVTMRGAHSYYWRAYDQAGNRYDTSIYTVKLSDVIPKVMVTAKKKVTNQEYTQGTWSNEKVRLTVGLKQASPEAKFYYAVRDKGEAGPSCPTGSEEDFLETWTLLNDSALTVEDDSCRKTYYFFAVTKDGAPSVSLTKFAVWQDTVAPELELKAEKKEDEAYTSGSWTNQEVSVKASLKEKLKSGATIYYKERDMHEADSEAPECPDGSEASLADWELLDGTYKAGRTGCDKKVYFFAVSGSGIPASQLKEIRIKQDVTNPFTLPLEYYCNGSAIKINKWQSGDITVQGIVSDTESGIKKITYEVGTNPAVTVTDVSETAEGSTNFSFKIQDQGVNEIKVKVYDKAGNYVPCQAFKTMIDKKNPGIAVEASTNFESYSSGSFTPYDIVLRPKNTQETMSRVTYYYMVTKQGKTVPDFDASTWTKMEDETVTVIANEGKNGTQYSFVAMNEAGIHSGIKTVRVAFDTTVPAKISAKLMDPQSDIGATQGEITWYRAGKKKIKVTNPQDDCSAITTKLQVMKKQRLDEEMVEDDSLTTTLAPSMKEEVTPSLEDGVYAFYTQRVDGVGFESVSGTSYVYVDSTKPTINSVTYSDAANSIREKYDAVYNNQDIYVNILASDQLSGVKKVSFCVGEETESSKFLDAVRNGNGAYRIAIPEQTGGENFKGFLTIKVYDQAGNVSNTYRTKELVYQKNGSDIQMSLNKEASKWWASDLHLTTKVTDHFSKIQEIQYYVDNELVGSYQAPTGQVSSYTKELDLTKEAANSQGYTAKVIMKNQSGTVSAKELPVFIDKTAPVIKLEGIEEGSYANSNRNLEILTHETIYDLTNVSFTATKELDGAVSEYSVEGYGLSQVDDTANRLFTEEGRYDIVATAIDGAGNQAVSAHKTFVIDKTAPVLSITGVSDDSCNNENVQLQFSAIDSFYEDMDVKIEVERTLDGATYTNAVAGFAANQKHSTMTHTFTEDGTYRVTFYATDKAGNVAAPQIRTFTIDQNAPVITISGVSDYRVTDENVGVTVSVMESYFVTNTVNVVVMVQDVEGRIQPVEMPQWVNSGKNSVMTNQFTEDGIYQVVVTAKDKAGNKAEQTLHFTIDRMPPVITAIEDLNGNYYKSLDLDKIVNESVKDLSVPTVNIYLNGLECQGGVLTEDGKYNLKIEAWDELGHTSEKQAEFVIDGTPPKVIFTGIEEGATVYNSFELGIGLELDIDTIEKITINGAVKDLPENQSSFVFPITEFGNYTVEVLATDYAGNTTNTTFKFRLMKEATRTALITVMVGSISLIMLLLLLLALGRRKGKTS